MARPKASIDQRIESFNDKYVDDIDANSNDPCWNWIGSVDCRGYGRFWDGSRVINAHRFSYEFIGKKKIVEGMQIDHLCRNRKCVNPRHLEQVSQQENLRRGEGACARNARKTHCVNGHPLSSDNLMNRSRDGRECKKCSAVNSLKRYYRKKSHAT